jgi:hypothetical protein
VTRDKPQELLENDDKKRQKKIVKDRKKERKNNRVTLKGLWFGGKKKFNQEEDTICEAREERHDKEECIPA